MLIFAFSSSRFAQDPALPFEALPDKEEFMQQQVFSKYDPLEDGKLIFWVVCLS